jgi:hypothetical protein
MKAEDIVSAFSEREVLDRVICASEFEDMACSIARLRESDQLKLLPLLMAYVLDHQNDGWKTNYGEMIVFCLMPQPAGWANLIDEMNALEIKATLKWLVSCNDFPFAVNCMDELRLAIEWFSERDGNHKLRK